MVAFYQRQAQELATNTALVTLTFCFLLLPSPLFPFQFFLSLGKDLLFLSNISFAAFSAFSTFVIYLRFFFGGPSAPSVGVAVRLPDGVRVAVRLPDGVSVVWLLDGVLVSNGALPSL